MTRTGTTRFAKFLPLLLLLIVLPLVLSGCGGGAPPVREKSALEKAQAALTEVDRTPPGERRGLRDRLVADATSKLGVKAIPGEPGSLSQALRQRPETSLSLLELAYAWESTPPSEDQGGLATALALYRELRGTPYGSLASVRVAQIKQWEWHQDRRNSRFLDADRDRREAVSAFESLATLPAEAWLLYRVPNTGQEPIQEWRTLQIAKDRQAVEARAAQDRQDYAGDGRIYVLAQLDELYQPTWQYKVLAALTRLGGGGNTSKVLLLFLLAILAKLVTTPFSIAQFRSMRAMQLFQPELKKLQDKYKDDKQALARAQMELMKEHKINPASSCLPTILQMVILIGVYYAIRHFQYQFLGVHFLYLSSLSAPDLVRLWASGPPVPGPLLVLYAASMYFTQKLISMPAATPEQQQQQRMMAVMMPFFMLLVMQGLPSAFILYWFVQNVLMTGHQYLIMRPHREADAARAAAAAAGEGPAGPREPEPKGKSSRSEPPDTIQRLAQGRPAAKKKRKRR